MASSTFDGLKRCVKSYKIMHNLKFYRNSTNKINVKNVNIIASHKEICMTLLLGMSFPVLWTVFFLIIYSALWYFRSGQYK